jgi:uncharacterized protein (TIGR03118 family)
MLSPNPKRTAFSALLVFTLLLLIVGSAMAQHYTRTDLTTDSASVSPAPNLDKNLVNAWGVARSSGSPWWISDNGTGLSTLYDLNGVAQTLVVTVPLPNGQTGTSTPTGTVFNYTNGEFEVAPGQRAIFIFVTEDGTISGWNPNVDATNAIVKVDNSKSGAVYKGCAIATIAGGRRLYVTNFASGNVEMYNGNFHQIMRTAFQDPQLPKNFVPFGIQNIGGSIVVTYAKRLPGETDEQHGAGLGYVNVYDLDGNLVLRLKHGSYMNAPWGIALAPGDFGSFSHRLLIGNFGDGTILAFNAVSGKFEGKFQDANGATLSIDGLWALSFGANSTNSGLATELYFTAGPAEESHGVFGKLAAVGADQRGNSE